MEGWRAAPAVTLLAAAQVLAAVPAGYRAEIEAFRAQREERLRAEGGWLSLAALYWLKEGDNTFGTDPGSDLVLPAGTAPAHAGRLLLRGGQTSVKLEADVAATIGGQPVAAAEMRADTTGTPDVLKLGRLSLSVIERNGRRGVRVRDPQSASRLGFTGLQWFPVDEGWRVSARFVPHPRPRPVELADVTGGIQKMTAPGYVVFRRGGQELRLEPVLEAPEAKELFFLFRDGTSGHGTYGGGRYLYTPLPEAGAVTLDFNKAVNPPCAFTNFATCPLPPRQNRLRVAVPAGEKLAGAH
jgi:uncharacterized protein